MDFEGYKIFRSTDQGLTWGKVVTDVTGRPMGYHPIAIFDLDNDVKGPDPAFPQHLGDNSGLAYSYVDSNLINGFEYWYCVTAYDHGDQDPDSLEQSYMYPLGASVFEPHTISAIPGPIASDQAGGELIPLGAACEGSARIIIINPDNVTGHGYRFTFSNQAILADDIVPRLGITLVDTTEMDTLLNMYPMPYESAEFLPVVDGLLLLLEDVTPGVKSIGWTEVHGDTSSFDWYTHKKTTSVQEADEFIAGGEDFKIVVMDESNPTPDIPFMDGLFTDTIYDSISIPIKVYKVTDPDHPIDVSMFTQVFDLRNYFPTSDVLGPLGWDLIPGGAGYNLMTGQTWPDIITLRDGDTEDANQVWLKTQNGPDTAIAPSVGDEFTIITKKPFRPGVYYEFGTFGNSAFQAVDIEVDDPLGDVRVVPDPYIVTNMWETSEFGKKLQFTNLPSECTIKIFTLVGERVATIDHHSDRSFAFWDMRNHNDQFIAPGVYLYAITTPSGDKALGRFLVIK
jgi:hypothetical protein